MRPTTCAGCGYPTSPDWAACPLCGRDLSRDEGAVEVRVPSLAATATGARPSGPSGVAPDFAATEQVGGGAPAVPVESVVCGVCGYSNEVAQGRREAFACAGCSSRLSWCGHCGRFTTSERRPPKVCDECGFVKYA